MDELYSERPLSAHSNNLGRWQCRCSTTGKELIDQLHDQPLDCATGLCCTEQID